MYFKALHNSIYSSVKLLPRKNHIRWPEESQRITFLESSKNESLMNLLEYKFSKCMPVCGSSRKRNGINHFLNEWWLTLRWYWKNRSIRTWTTWDVISHSPNCPDLDISVLITLKQLQTGWTGLSRSWRAGQKIKKKLKMDKSNQNRQILTLLDS